MNRQNRYSGPDAGPADPVRAALGGHGVLDVGLPEEVALVTGRTRLARRGPPFGVTLRHLGWGATMIWSLPVIVRVFKSSANV